LNDNFDNDRQDDILSFVDTHVGQRVVYPQVDVLFRPFVTRMIEESRRFLKWSKEMQDYVETLEGTKEQKDQALSYLRPITEEEIDELENLLTME
jgi:uncharacterized protein Yka (UPF0111/DUF47 family)